MGIVFTLTAAAPCAGRAAPPEPLITDPHTGLALSGIDPVAYFTDGRPMFGRADLEMAQGGAVWRFRNEGDRAAFAEHPEVYGPRFGGYDPVAIARGRSVPGHPFIWAVVGERLYLFYSSDARRAFLADPGRIVADAERRWPAVSRTIERP